MMEYAGVPEIVILGDSHVHALDRAYKRSGQSMIAGRTAFVSRFHRKKGERVIEGVTMEEAIERAARLGRDDLLVSAIGGNEYSILGMIQHPVPFDYVEPDMPVPPAPDAQLIPCTTIENLFEASLTNGNMPRVAQLRGATAAPVIQLPPPPPKEDGAFVLSRADTLFKSRNIGEFGVSPAPLRLKLWFTQMRLMRRACAAIDVILLSPPPAALTPEGYLDPRYYGHDATHANVDYGALVLEMLAERAALLESAA